ncbi:MAG TPA: 16S rRNA (adenine(1518)-N(6)/adenine(1519)-N(6))-dimethyltransferase RsmA [Pyrinomonadaceae bacterium]
MVRAKKSLGQNFLEDERVVERIVEALGPRADETIIEIGPGRGALTSRLVEMAGRLVAIELDRELAGLLRERFGARANFQIVEGDALDADLCSLVAPEGRARVVANLPYYISTAILQRLIEQRRCITGMVLMLQREVVERITAPPASSERGYLSVMVEAYASAETLFDVSPASFRPVPKVWSTVVRLSMRPRMGVPVEDEALFRQLVSAGFAQRRKTILNNLRGAPDALRLRIEEAGGAGPLLEAAGVAPVRRAETLTLEEWARVARIIEGTSAGL